MLLDICEKRTYSFCDIVVEKKLFVVKMNYCCLKISNSEKSIKSINLNLNKIVFCHKRILAFYFSSIDILFLHHPWKRESTDYILFAKSLLL